MHIFDFFKCHVYIEDVIFIFQNSDVYNEDLKTINFQDKIQPQYH